jgi:hypothetical protein
VVLRVRPRRRTGTRSPGRAYSESMAVVGRAGRGGWTGGRGGGAAAAGAALLTVSIYSIDKRSAQLMKGVLN